MLRKVLIYMFLACIFVVTLNLVIASVPKPEYTLYPGQRQVIVEGYMVINAAAITTNGRISPFPMAVFSGKIVIIKRPYPTVS